MDKSDVEMEDAEKKALDVGNHVLEPQHDTVDSNSKPEDTKLDCLAVNGVQPETEDSNYNSKSGAKSPINGENEDEEQRNGSTVDNQCNASDIVEDRKNAISETEDQLNSRSEPEAHGNVVNDDKTSSKFESQGPNNAKGDADDGIIGGAEAPDQNKNENRERELEGDVALQKNEPTSGAAEDDTRSGNVQLPDDEIVKAELEEVRQSEKMIYEVSQNGKDMMVDEQKDPQVKTDPATARSDELPKAKSEVNGTATEKTPEPATPKFTAKAGQHSGEASKNFCKMADNEDEYEDGDDDGSLEDQAAFMRELESFYRDRAMEFKPPKFYGNPLNCLKLWRSVIRLGGYDRVTGSKLWRQVGESFNPPKTCTTVSWTFRIFYEKALLEYEKHKIQSGELQLPVAPPPDSLGVENEGNGYQASASGGRARRDSAARAIQGWHGQRLGYVEDKNNNMPKREKNLKNIGSLKHKRQNEVEHPVKVARTETFKQLSRTLS